MEDRINRNLPPRIMGKTSCARTACDEPGVWMPELHFWVDERHRDSSALPYVAAMPELRVCEEHHNELKLENIMDDRGWNFMVKSFMKAKKAIPDRKLTELYWRLLGGGG